MCIYIYMHMFICDVFMYTYRVLVALILFRILRGIRPVAKVLKAGTGTVMNSSSGHGRPDNGDRSHGNNRHAEMGVITIVRTMTWIVATMVEHSGGLFSCGLACSFSRLQVQQD